MFKLLIILTIFSSLLTISSQYEIMCKGVYDKSMFARLDAICDDCYNLFREPIVHQLCR